jgi:hypothetical protein
VVVVPIHESIVNKLDINDECTWFEEIPASEGIFLKFLDVQTLALPETSREK